MRGSIQLKVLAGTTLKPLSFELLQGLVSAKVDVGPSGAAGFELQFELPLRSTAHSVFVPLRGEGAQDAGAPAGKKTDKALEFGRVFLALVIEARLEPLIDGVVTFVQSRPSGNGSSSLTVTGKDLTALMNRDDASGQPFGARTASQRVEKILAKYKSWGVEAKVVAEAGEQAKPVGREIPGQQGTDYAYVMQLASDAGYVFYLEPGAEPGQSTAYWGPEVRVGTLQPALITNMDAFNTVEELDFTFDPEQNEAAEVLVEQPGSRRFQRVTAASPSALDAPLGRLTPREKRVQLPDVSLLSPSEVRQRARAHARRTRDVVRGQGRLDVARYARVLRSHRLVSVRGADAAFNGEYYVTRVTHELTRGSCLQTFGLARDALDPKETREQRT